MSQAKLTVGLHSDTKQLIHIQNAARGLACNCICPKCNSQLVAKKGAKTTHHFAHHSTEECEGSWETALHLYAKQLLMNAQEVTIPQILIKRTRRADVLIQDAQVYKFEGLILEKSYTHFQPDASITEPHQLFVEFAVTHFSEPEKIVKLKDYGVSTIEVDLSKTPFELSQSELDQYILHDAPREWLHSVKLGIELERIRAKEKEDAEKAAIEETIRAQKAKDKHAEEMATQFLAFQKIWKTPYKPPEEVFPKWWNPIQTLKNNRIYIGTYQPSSPFLFEVEPRVWQAAIVDAFILKRIREGQYKHSTRHFNADIIFHWLLDRKLLPSLFSVYYDADHILDYANSFGHFGDGPYADTQNFLIHLERQKLIWEDNKGNYRLSKFHHALNKYASRYPSKP
ncbi:hypothetical protein KFE96_04275 [Kordiimonas sp. SCSIO 12603]|uniref:competence protein CoiA family protein n=1 Tax=Kordiimonas sp. SCSIO 12603 TaxID=2829596 RepID=UPI0021062533|nr:competence protein CoiA family protein [Kordiimonas sp. SCSIO 12603]UTW59528.1 hypothetical protein KFE96_04275 [Kordiimonas sp. SCSIO 12603]